MSSFSDIMFIIFKKNIDNYWEKADNKTKLGETANWLILYKYNG